MMVTKKRWGEKGFTLIELLIVVAILGILAAVVVPNLGRLLGGGQVTARNTEYENIKTSVVSMMVDNGLAILPNRVTAVGSGCTTSGTQDMTNFPDDTANISKGTDAIGNTYDASDKAGFILFGHDAVANSATTPLTNYVEIDTAKSCYTVDAQGTITQYDTDGNQTNP